MPLVQSLIALKTVAGIAGVVSALYTNKNDDGSFAFKKFPEAFFGEIFGGIIADCFRHSLSGGLEGLRDKYSTIDLDKDRLNYDLQKAARKAQLIATFFAAQYCLEEVRAENVKANAEQKSSLIGRTIKMAKAMKIKDRRELYFEDVIEYLNQEIKTSGNAVIESLKFDDLLIFFETYKTTTASKQQSEVSRLLVRDICNELELAAKFSTAYFDPDALSLLASTMYAGWDEIRRERVLSESYVTLNLTALGRLAPGKKYDWFSLVCSIFNEEYKNNPRVTAAAQKQLLLDITDKLDTFGVLNTRVSILTSRISKLAGELKKLRAVIERLEIAVEEGFSKLSESGEENTQRIITRLQQLSTETSHPQTFVISLDLDEKVYGRTDEVNYILEFLRGRSKHAAVVAPSCFGKTYLIKKLLLKTKDGNQVKATFGDLFTRVIYLDCRRNRKLKGIVSHFETLMGKKLEVEGDHVNFLNQKIFTQLQHEKILFIIDNFESWIGADSHYINSDVSDFIHTLFNTNHQVRTLFVSQRLPHEEDDFFTKVQILEKIGDKLLRGLSRRAALELVRNEGESVGLKGDRVTDKELAGFFEKVFYIPQAIQSMIGYLRKTGVSFSDFQQSFWKFEELESRSENLLEKIDKKLRPTRALIKYQLSAQDDATKHLLSVMSFLDTPAPDKILIVDFSEGTDLSGGKESDEYQIALRRLTRHFLTQVEKDEQTTLNKITDSESDVKYYFLHPFILEIARQVLPKFEEENSHHFEDWGDYINDLAMQALEHRNLKELNSLSECQRKIESHLVYILGDETRLSKLAQSLVHKGNSFTETDRALKEFDEALRQEAEKSYRAAIDLSPEFPKSYYNLGVLLDKDTKRTDEAIQAYRKAIELDPTYVSAYCNLGVLLKDCKGEWQEGEVCFRKAIELDPSHAHAYSNLGALLKDCRGEWQEGEECFRKAIELDPSLPMAHVGLGWILFDSRNLRPEAEECYRQAIKLDPDNEWAHNNLGVLCEKEGRLPEAEECYRKALEIDPHFSRAYNNLSSLLFKDKSRWREAEEFHHQAIKADPKNADAYYNLGYLLDEDESRWAEAEACYLKSVELDPGDAVNYRCLGVLLGKTKGRWPDAEKYYRKAIEIAPDDAVNHRCLADLLANQETRLHEAEESCRKAIELNPAYSSAYISLGKIIAEDKKRWDEARGCYSKAIEIDPKHAYAHNQVGHLLRLQNNFSGAIEACLTAISLDDTFLSPRLILASIYKKTFNYEASNKYAQECFSLIKDGDYYDLACLHSILENKEKALELLKLALIKNPSLKSWSKEDPDLEWLRAHEAFWTIVDVRHDLI